MAGIFIFHFIELYICCSLNIYYNTEGTKNKPVPIPTIPEDFAMFKFYPKFLILNFYETQVLAILLKLKLAKIRISLDS